MQQKLIRNFSIIAHIDHGKSTLADRLLELCGAIDKRDMKEQFLDNLEVERERGITVKSQTARLKFTAKDGQEYLLNMMDTPGHVDFTYEVSHCLAACEGAILLVDAAQGVEAQTVANCYLADERNLEMIPVINKVDLPAADAKGVKQQIEEIIGIPTDDAISISAKMGTGITEVLEACVKLIPPPKGDPDKPLKAMLVDSWYNPYRGVVIMTRIFDGSLKKGDKIKLMATNAEYTVDDLGIFSPKEVSQAVLSAGEVGWIVASIKELAECTIGDTITTVKNPCEEALPGFKPQLPAVFCGFFPEDAAEFGNLRKSVEKLAINDAGFYFQAEHSNVLGSGFRCGFLGLLHLDIVRERLDDEFAQDVIVTAPTVSYRVETTDNKTTEINSPAEFPDATRLQRAFEPWVKATIICPGEYLGPLLDMLTARRGIQLQMKFSGMNRAVLTYEIPLAEIVFDFHDRLKSLSRGYASFDYEICDWREIELQKLEILVNGEAVEALSIIVPKAHLEKRARALCERLKELIPRQLYKVAIQAMVGGKVIARETVGATRKDVTAKCYGGDVSRKRKLLEKQKRGKKRMARYGNVEIPPQTFVEVMKYDAK